MTITLSFAAPAGLRPDWPAGMLSLGDLAPSPEVVSIPEPTELAAVAGATPLTRSHAVPDVALGELGEELHGRHVRPRTPVSETPPVVATIHSVVLGEHAWLVVDASLDSSTGTVDPLPVETVPVVEALHVEALHVDALTRTTGAPLPTVADLLVLLGAAAARTGLTLEKTALPADQSQAQVADLTVTGLGGSPVRGQPCIVVVTTTPGH